MLTYAREHNDVDASYPLPGEACTLGLCTGTLAAAAISCCRSISELLPVAIQTVLVAFRTGLCVLDVRSRIEAPIGSSPAWSMVVGGNSATEAIDAMFEFRNQSVSGL